MPNANKLINHNKSKNTFFNDITNIYLIMLFTVLCRNYVHLFLI